PDDWFRPVNLFHGPDGALYVVDMYRAVIEHPDFMPPELKKRPDLLLGQDKGRIWRIVPQNHVAKAIGPALGPVQTNELVKLLERDDGWWRLTAHRLLLERGNQPSLSQLLSRGLADPELSPHRQVHAAWLLHHFGELNLRDWDHLLRSKHPRVREHAVRLGDSFPRAALPPARVAALADDSDPRVRFQVA